MADKDSKTVNFEKLKETVRTGVRMQDNVIDATPYFLEDNKVQALGERRVGLGVMGLADLHIYCEKEYGSPEGNQLVDEVFEAIATTAYRESIELAKENKYEIPKNSFDNSIILKVGNKNVSVKFFGQGHTKDNVVGYFPSENIMFGGCLIKELNAGKGYLGDANVAEWSNTVEKVEMEYPNVKIVVPGHGEYGDRGLLDYTIKLFKIQ